MTGTTVGKGPNQKRIEFARVGRGAYPRKARRDDPSGCREPERNVLYGEP